MALSGLLGNGIKIGYSTTSPVSWTGIGQVLDGAPPTFVSDSVEITTSSTTSKWKRTMPGLDTVNDMSVTVLADTDPATSVDQDYLFTALKNGTQLWWRFEVPTNRARTTFTAFEWQGTVGGWELSLPIAGRQELKVTVKYDGTSFTKYAPAASAIP